VLACVPLYPPTDLLALFDYGGRWTRRMTERTTPWIFGASPTEDPERYRHWSPVTLVRPGLVPFLVVQGTGDNLVPYRQTLAFVDRLRAQPGQHAVYLELPGAPHAFEVFHSFRAEAAAAGIHRFCSWVNADAMVASVSEAGNPPSSERPMEAACDLTEGRAAPPDSAAAHHAAAVDDARIDAEAR
jgi:acetyl esterase/lipase